MRRFTLLTIVVLFALLTAAAVYQVLLVRGKPRQYVGPGLSPPPGAVILRNLTGRDRDDVLAELEDAGLRDEVRQLVLARNERRVRAGKAPLDVDAEVERRIRELT